MEQCSDVVWPACTACMHPTPTGAQKLKCATCHHLSCNPAMKHAPRQALPANASDRHSCQICYEAIPNNDLRCLDSLPHPQLQG